jgi:uncharacterized membrane protein (UPF0127 family)
MKALNLRTKEEVACEVTVAEGLFARMKGLLGKKTMPRDTALLIVPCKSVHTFGMQFPLDVIFLDRRKRVIALNEHLVPNRLSAWHLRAVSVLEMPSGKIAATHTQIGDEIEIA